MGRTNSDKDFPVVRRWFVAVYHHIALEGLNFKSFCDLYGLPRTVLLRMEKEPHRHFRTEWLTFLVEKLGYSAEWLLTGNGPMKAKKLKAEKEGA